MRLACDTAPGRVRGAKSFVDGQGGRADLQQHREHGCDGLLRIQGLPWGLAPRKGVANACPARRVTPRSSLTIAATAAQGHRPIAQPSSRPRRGGARACASAFMVQLDVSHGRGALSTLEEGFLTGLNVLRGLAAFTVSPTRVSWPTAGARGPQRWMRSGLRDVAPRSPRNGRLLFRD